MAFSQSDLDVVNRAIASGALTVEYGDKRVTYRSMADLMQARRVILEDLASQSGSVQSDAAYATFVRE